jgi:hypothetical protein
MKRIKVKVGDVFAIPLGNGEYGFSQIIDDIFQQCYVIYDYKSQVFPDPKEIVKYKILVLTYTVDVFIQDRRWPLVGNATPSSDVIFPEYIIGSSENERVMDHHGKTIRKATEEDKKKLTHMTSVSPALLENIAQHLLLGSEEMPKHFDISKYIYRGHSERYSLNKN